MEISGCDVRTRKSAVSPVTRQPIPGWLRAGHTSTPTPQLVITRPPETIGWVWSLGEKGRRQRRGSRGTPRAGSPPPRPGGVGGIGGVLFLKTRSFISLYLEKNHRVVSCIHGDETPSIHRPCLRVGLSKSTEDLNCRSLLWTPYQSCFRKQEHPTRGDHKATHIQVHTYARRTDVSWAGVCTAIWDIGNPAVFSPPIFLLCWVVRSFGVLSRPDRGGLLLDTCNYRGHVPLIRGHLES